MARAPQHECQGGGFGADDTAGHGGVDEAASGGGVDCVCDFSGGGGVDCRGVNEEAVMLDRESWVKGGKAGVKDVSEDRFHVRGLGKDGDDDVL